MQSEERLLAALQREQPDRVPVVVWLNPLAPRWATGIDPDVDPQAAGYGPVLDAALEYADLIHDWYYPTGFFFSAYDVQQRSERVGPERVRHTIQTPKGELSCIVQDRPGGGTEKHWVESVEDVECVLSIPYIAPRADLSEFLRLRDQLRGQSLAQVTLPDAVCGLDVVDPELRSLWTLTERDLVREVVDISHRRICEMLDYLLQQGVGPLYYFNGPEYAIPPLMSPRDFDEFVVRYDQELVARVHAHGQLTQHHCHGRVSHFLERFVEMGTDSLNPLEPPPLGDVVLSDAKRRVGSRMCLMGNIQYEDLASTSIDGVEELVRETVAQGAPGGGFILSLCAAPYEVPLPPKTAENLIHFMKMGRKYGGY